MQTKVQHKQTLNQLISAVTNFCRHFRKIVVNPLQTAFVNGAATTPGHALTRRYGEKMTKHGEGCRRAGMVFLPLPVETLGGWHDQTVSLVKRLGSALARQTGQEESEAIRHLAQRLAVLLAKGNAALLLNRVPIFPLMDRNKLVIC